MSTCYQQIYTGITIRGSSIPHISSEKGSTERIRKIPRVSSTEYRSATQLVYDSLCPYIHATTQHWEETRDDSKSQELQKSVLNVLLKTSQRDASLDPNREPHWLSTRHVRALMTLLETIRKTPCPTTAPDEASRFSKEQLDLHRAHNSGNVMSTDLCPIPDQTYAAFDQM